MKTWILDKLKKFKAHLFKAHKSLTIWFNSIIGMAVVVLPVAQENVSQLQGYLPENLFHYAMYAIIVGNILLRFKTDKALADK